MIKHLKINGFKDQYREIRLTGLDLFTSDNVNGAGKSAVLESFKLAALGELPGRAKNLEDILKYTSQDEISIGAEFDDGKRPVFFKRTFRRDGKQGERRPISIDRVALKYEEGNHWIQQNIGAVSIGFDPNEFLNLTGPKKLQWIISNSPESWALTRDWAHLVFLARLTEKYLGAGLVSHLLSPYGIKELEQLFDSQSLRPVSEMTAVLRDAFINQNPELWEIIDKTLKACWQVWSPSNSGEENLKSIRKLLKSVIAERKGALKEQSSAISCLKPEGSASEAGSIETERRAIRELAGEIETICISMERKKADHESGREREERKKWLREEISKLAGQTPASIHEYDGRVEELNQGLVDIHSLEEELSRLGGEYQEALEKLRSSEDELEKNSSRLSMKRKKFEAVNQARIHCPVTESIVCDTDMEPYRSALDNEIKEHELSLEKLLDLISELQPLKESLAEKKEALLNRLGEARAWNEGISNQLEELKEKRNSLQREEARLTGMSNAYRKELFELERSFPSGKNLEALDPCEELQRKKNHLMNEKKSKEEKLESLLRAEGKRQSLAELKNKRNVLERELEILKQVETLSGPAGMSMDIAVSAAMGLEREVGKALRLLDDRLKCLKVCPLIMPSQQKENTLIGTGLIVGWR